MQISNTVGASYYTPGTQSHSFSVIPEFATKHFFVGAGSGIALPQNTFTIPEGITITYKPALVYGAHMGLRQKLGKHLALTQRIAYSTMTAKTTTEIPRPEFMQQTNGTIAFCGPMWGTETGKSKMSFYTAQLGLVYSF